MAGSTLIYSAIANGIEPARASSDGRAAFAACCYISANASFNIHANLTPRPAHPLPHSRHVDVHVLFPELLSRLDSLVRAGHDVSLPCESVAFAHSPRLFQPYTHRPNARVHHALICRRIGSVSSRAIAAGNPTTLDPYVCCVQAGNDRHDEGYPALVKGIVSGAICQKE